MLDGAMPKRPASHIRTTPYEVFGFWFYPSMRQGFSLIGGVSLLHFRGH